MNNWQMLTLVTLVWWTAQPPQIKCAHFADRALHGPKETAGVNMKSWVHGAMYLSGLNHWNKPLSPVGLIVRP